MILYDVVETGFGGASTHTLFKKKSNALVEIEELKKKYMRDETVKVIEDDEFHKGWYNDNGFSILREDRQLNDRIYLEEVKTKD